MTDYMILLPDDEDSWLEATEDQKKGVYARHEEFVRLLAERGHRIKHGAELSHSRTARTVRGDMGAVTITEGPYAETVEQLSGYYMVQSDDLDDLLDICGLLAGSGAVEVRAVVGGVES